MTEIGWPEVREILDRMAMQTEQWQGIPVPIEGHRLVVHDRHPLAVLYGQPERKVDTTVRNSWFSRQRQGYVYIINENDKITHLFVPTAPDRSMARFTMWLDTLGASDAWTVEAEANARVKLRTLLTPRQWNLYYLTGTFLEYSARSGVTYLFRRSRPTVAMVPFDRRDGENSAMKVLSVRCGHPIGWYVGSGGGSGTWAGAMVPSDDVIAHLLLCRHDEARFWKVTNAHQPDAPEAGI